MITIDHLPALRQQVKTWKAQGRVAFVPTMGNLHEGHLTLVREAQKIAEFTIVSVFVNPLQFGAGEDLDAYPRTLQRDQEMLESIGTSLLFAPNVDDVYGRPQDEQTKVEVPGLSSILCGATRPIHFRGVATVVTKLFNMVQPDVALFGKKDYQQLMVLRRMTEDLNMPIEILGVDIVRESDGLAMSSRNGYLTQQERDDAPYLQQILQVVKQKLENGERDYASLQRWATEELNASVFKTDYFEIRKATDLREPESDTQSLVVLAAAYLGKARLIDNIEVNL